MNPARLLRLRLVAVVAAFLVVPYGPVWAGADEVARAVAVVQRVMELNTRFEAQSIALVAPAPLEGAKGKFLLPVKGDGQLTEWAQKAVSAQVGNVVGEQVADEAAKRTVGAIPLVGGFAGGLAKKKGKEVGAMVALGGAEFVEGATTHSFDKAADYAVYLHTKMGNSPDYSKAVQAAIALYPDLEKSYAKSVSAAYDAAAKAAAAQKAAEEKAAKEAEKKAAEKPAASAS